MIKIESFSKICSSNERCRFKGDDFAGRKQELGAARHFLQNGQSVVVIVHRGDSERHRLS